MENTRHSQLSQFISVVQKKAATTLAIAILFSMAGIALFACFVLMSQKGSDLITPLTAIKILLLLMVAALLQVPALLLFISAGKARNQVHQLQKEQVKIYDLDKAIELSRILGESTVLKEEEMRCRIIQTLLDRYAE